MQPSRGGVGETRAEAHVPGRGDISPSRLLQLRAMLRKNWTQKRRAKLSLLGEVGLPFLFTLGLVLLWIVSSTKTVDGQSFVDENTTIENDATQLGVLSKLFCVAPSRHLWIPSFPVTRALIGDVHTVEFHVDLASVLRRILHEETNAVQLPSPPENMTIEEMRSDTATPATFDSSIVGGTLKRSKFIRGFAPCPTTVSPTHTAVHARCFASTGISGVAFCAAMHFDLHTVLAHPPPMSVPSIDVYWLMHRVAMTPEAEPAAAMFKHVRALRDSAHLYLTPNTEDTEKLRQYLWTNYEAFPNFYRRTYGSVEDAIQGSGVGTSGMTLRRISRRETWAVIEVRSLNNITGSDVVIHMKRNSIPLTDSLVDKYAQGIGAFNSRVYLMSGFLTLQNAIAKYYATEVLGRPAATLSAHPPSQRRNFRQEARESYPHQHDVNPARKESPPRKEAPQAPHESRSTTPRRPQEVKVIPLVRSASATATSESEAPPNASERQPIDSPSMWAYAELGTPSVIPMPFPSFTESSFLTTAGSIAPLALVFGYLFPISQLTKKLVEEKESRAREAMLIMGLDTASFFCSWLFTYSAITTVTAALCTAVSSVTFLPTTSPVAIFALFWLFGQCAVSLSVLLSAFISTSRVAAIVAPALFFALAIPSFVLPSNASQSPTLTFFLSLLPPSAFAMGANVFFADERRAASNDGGGRWASTVALFQESPFSSLLRENDGGLRNVSVDGYDATIQQVLLMLMIDALVCLLAGLYFDAVIPQQWGAPKHPLFFLIDPFMSLYRWITAESAITKKSRENSNAITTSTSKTVESSEVEDKTLPQQKRSHRTSQAPEPSAEHPPGFTASPPPDDAPTVIDVEFEMGERSGLLTAEHPNGSDKDDDDETSAFEERNSDEPASYFSMPLHQRAELLELARENDWLVNADGIPDSRDPDGEYEDEFQMLHRVPNPDVDPNDETRRPSNGENGQQDQGDQRKEQRKGSQRDSCLSQSRPSVVLYTGRARSSDAHRSTRDNRSSSQTGVDTTAVAAVGQPPHIIFQPTPLMNARTGLVFGSRTSETAEPGSPFFVRSGAGDDAASFDSVHPSSHGAIRARGSSCARQVDCASSICGGSSYAASPNNDPRLSAASSVGASMHRISHSACSVGMNNHHAQRRPSVSLCGLRKEFPSTSDEHSSTATPPASRVSAKSPGPNANVNQTSSASVCPPSGLSCLGFGAPFVAVDNLTLDFYENEVTVLLGHNGAGKTTAINVMTGMLAATSGDCFVYGKSITHDLRGARAEIGVCPQHNILWDGLTCREHLEFFAALKGVPSEELEESAREMLVAVDLLEKADEFATDLSGGQKRKLSVAIAFIGGSRMVFLDEPTAGMDVAARRFTWDLIKKMSPGRTIVLTTHFMDEADLLGDTIAVMSEGRLRCAGSPLFLKSRLGVGYTLTLSLPATHASQAVVTNREEVVTNGKKDEMGTRPPSGASNTIDDDDDDETEANTVDDLEPDAERRSVQRQGQVAVDRDQIVFAIRTFVPDAAVVTNTSGELALRLPMDSVKSFPALLSMLEKTGHDELGVAAHGIAVTTLEHVFLQIGAIIEGKRARREALLSLSRSNESRALSLADSPQVDAATEFPSESQPTPPGHVILQSSHCGNRSSTCAMSPPQLPHFCTFHAVADGAHGNPRPTNRCHRLSLSASHQAPGVPTDERKRSSTVAVAVGSVSPFGIESSPFSAPFGTMLPNQSSLISRPRLQSTPMTPFVIFENDDTLPTSRPAPMGTDGHDARVTLLPPPALRLVKEPGARSGRGVVQGQAPVVTGNEEGGKSDPEKSTEKDVSNNNNNNDRRATSVVFHDVPEDNGGAAFSSPKAKRRTQRSFHFPNDNVGWSPSSLSAQASPVFATAASPSFVPDPGSPGASTLEQVQHQKQNEGREEGIDASRMSVSSCFASPLQRSLRVRSRQHRQSSPSGSGPMGAIRSGGVDPVAVAAAEAEAHASPFGFAAAVAVTPQMMSSFNLDRDDSSHELPSSPRPSLAKTTGPVLGRDNDDDGDADPTHEEAPLVRGDTQAFTEQRNVTSNGSGGGGPTHSTDFTESTTTESETTESERTRIFGASSTSHPAKHGLLTNVDATADGHGAVSKGERSEKEEPPIWYRIQRSPTYAQQFRAVMIKRWCNIKRDRRTQILQLVLPVVGIVLAMSLAMIDFMPAPEMAISSDLYDNGRVEAMTANCFEVATFVTNNSGTEIAGQTEPTSLTRTSASKLNEALLRTAKSHGRARPTSFICGTRVTKPTQSRDPTSSPTTPRVELQRRLARFKVLRLHENGTQLVEEIVAGSSLTAGLFTNETRYRHAAPLALNQWLQGAIDAQFQSGSTQSMHGSNVGASSSRRLPPMRIANHPLPLLGDDKDLVDSIKTFFVGLFIMIPFTFIPSTYVAWIVKEKESKARHLQDIAGMNFVVYWVANWCFDVASFLVTATLAMGVLFAFGREEYVGAIDRAATVFALFVFYGASSASAAYLLSFLFDSHSTAQNVTLMVNFICGFLLVLATYTMSLLDSAAAAADGVTWAFRTTPTFCLGNGVILLAMDFVRNGGSSDSASAPWSLGIAGANLLFMFIQCPVFFLLTLAFDHPSAVSQIKQCKVLTHRALQHIPFIHRALTHTAYDDGLEQDGLLHPDRRAKEEFVAAGEHDDSEEMTTEVTIPTTSSSSSFPTRPCSRDRGSFRRDAVEDEDVAAERRRVQRLLDEVKAGNLGGKLTDADDWVIVHGLRKTYASRAHANSDPTNVNHSDEHDAETEPQVADKRDEEGSSVTVAAKIADVATPDVATVKQDDHVNGHEHHAVRTPCHPRECTKSADSVNVAVKDLTFGVKRGEVFGFLGTNGAGKTTTMSILCGEQLPSAGVGLVAGYDVVESPAAARDALGYCPQFDALLDLLTVEEHLELYSRLRGLDGDDLTSTVESLITSCDLADHRSKEARALSGGNKRKLSVAIALVGGPQVLFLDEPSAGMDPGARRGLWDVIDSVAQHCSIVLTTHHLEEIEALSSRVAIMDQGEMKCIGSLQHLKSKFGSGFELALRVQADSDLDNARAFIKDELPTAELQEQHGLKLTFSLPQSTRLSKVFAVVEGRKEALRVTDYSVSQTSLESVFLKIAEGPGTAHR